MEENIKVLFVDDEQNVLNAVHRVFMDEDYTILSASSGPDGLAVLDKETIQVIVSDYRMPGMNGIEFLRQVKERSPQTIRIVLSGYADIATIVEAVNEGQIYKFIPKPWNDEELKVTIANALDRYFLYKKNIELTMELSKKNERLTELNEELNKLLEEKSENLEFRSKVVTIYQNILDTIPAGIMGIDSNNYLVLCNKTFMDLAGSTWCALGQSVSEGFPEEVSRFINEVSEKGAVKRRFVLSGIQGVLSGVSMKRQDSEVGVILVFMREDDL